MKLPQRIKLWLPVIVWCGVIFTFSSLPINHSKEFSWLDFIIKKTAHVAEYAILYWLVFRAVSNHNRIKQKSIFIYSFLFTLFYAFSDEWHQTFVIGREGTLRDVGFDTIGMLLTWSQLKNV
jgi:VanZ family protein